MSASAAGGRLSTIDLLFSVLDDPRRPFDFALLLDLDDAPAADALRAGARSARALYPTTASRIAGKRWTPFAEPGDGLAEVSARTVEEAERAAEEFVDSPFDPRRQTPVRQLLITGGAVGGGRAKLVTRFHHAAADGLSAALWLGRQLRVAYCEGNEGDEGDEGDEGNEGDEGAPVAAAAPPGPPPLRSHPSPVKKSLFAHGGPSDRLRVTGRRPSRTRRWLTLDFEAAPLRHVCREAGGFTYNDLLATCALELFLRWNRARGARGRLKVGLWLPVNVRRRSSEGFGNGTSRIRLYPRYDEAAPLADKCREVRRQVSWCIGHGEWAVPEKSPLTSLPLWAAAPLLRAYVGRPWVDVCTGVFSHAEGLTAAGGEIFRHVTKVESVGQLHARHALAINGVTHAGRTFLTFTYDPGLLPPADALRLAEMYRELLDLARRGQG